MTPKEIAERLFSLGFEVSSVTTYPGPKNIVAARILEIRRHPNADKLQLAKVTDGTETLTVVCGAPNIEVGQVVSWARVGAVLAEGTEIKETSIRGVKSPGMLCSLKELGVGDNHSGIWVLNEEMPLGTSIEAAAALEDVVFDIEVTPNRPDALSIIGIAREIAASANLKWAPPHYKFKDHASLPFYPVEIEDKGGCAQYIAKKLTNVAIGPSSPKIQVRLIRSGIRPINNIVDITNYVLLEMGQPLHAFDADKLEGGKILVRRARENESIAALDGNTYDLDTDLLVIADARRPVAVAGIMGGEETAVTDKTKNVLLESAIFSRGLIRYGSKKLGLSSESSYRFERGVTRWSAAAGSDDAESLIEETAGGHIAALSIVQSNPDEKIPSVNLRNSYVLRTLGEKIPVSEVAQIFQRLGISVLSSNEERLTVQPPPWRLDLEGEADFVEEIARLRGYDKVPVQGQTVRLPAAMGKAREVFRRGEMRASFSALGFDEAVNYGLVDLEEAAALFPRSMIAQIKNPLAQDSSALRPALVFELLKNLRSNAAYQKKNVRLCELGTVFLNIGGEISESLHAGAVAVGKTRDPSWQMKSPPPIDFYWIKGAAERILRDAGASFSLAPFKDLPGSPLRSFPDAHALFHPGFSMAVLGEKKEVLGVFGTVHPGYAKKWDVPSGANVLELNLSALEGRRRDPEIRKISLLPEIERDCSLWIKKDVLWGSVRSEIEASAGQDLKALRLFDVYTDPVRPGLKSLSFTLTFQSAEKTLSDEEANGLRDRVVQALSKKFAAELRRK